MGLKKTTQWQKHCMFLNVCMCAEYRLFFASLVSSLEIRNVEKQTLRVHQKVIKTSQLCTKAHVTTLQSVWIEGYVLLVCYHFSSAGNRKDTVMLCWRDTKNKDMTGNFLNFVKWKCCTRGQMLFTNSFTTLHHLWLCKNKLNMTPGSVTSGLSPLFRKISCLNSSSVYRLNLSNNRAQCNQLRVKHDNVSMFSFLHESFSVINLCHCEFTWVLFNQFSLTVPLLL